MLSVLLLATGACLETDEVEETVVDQELLVDDVVVPPELTVDDTAELSNGGVKLTKTDVEGLGTLEAQRYCVDQSYASAQRVGLPLFMACTRAEWNTSLSRNHPVHISGCGSGTYILAHSLWTGSSYIMRRDALRAC